MKTLSNEERSRLRELLAYKIEKEYADFEKDLLTKSAEEVIKEAERYVFYKGVKENLGEDYLKYSGLSDNQMEALLLQPNTLYALYGFWTSEDFADSILYCAGEAAHTLFYEEKRSGYHICCRFYKHEEESCPDRLPVFKFTSRGDKEPQMHKKLLLVARTLLEKEGFDSIDGEYDLYKAGDKKPQESHKVMVTKDMIKFV